MVKCEICKKEFSMITPTHLKSHGTTTEKYKKKFKNSPMRDFNIINSEIECEICGQSLGLITKSHLDKHNVSIDDYLQMFPKAKLVNTMDKDIKEIPPAYCLSCNFLCYSDKGKPKCRYSRDGFIYHNVYKNNYCDFYKLNRDYADLLAAISNHTEQIKNIYQTLTINNLIQPKEDYNATN